MPLTNPITTIFFSADHTLRSVNFDPNTSYQAASGILRLIQARETIESLFRRLDERWAVYRREAEGRLLETGERELWARYLLPEYEPNMVYANATSLTRLWLEREGRRVLRPGMREVLEELCRRGYTLGILENTPSEDELPDWLVTEGLVQRFRTVLLSSKIRLRKPDPAAYRLAARCAGASVGQCAFVGGGADMEGAGAVFARTVRMEDGEPPFAEAQPPELLLEQFPDRGER